MYSIYKQNTYGILLQNISTGLGIFWDDFTGTQNPSETWTHPPTSIVNSDFLNFLFCNAPNTERGKRIVLCEEGHECSDDLLGEGDSHLDTQTPEDGEQESENVIGFI